jgi:very-short-patch-repair endonuclease
MSPSGVHRMVGAREWRAVHPRVYALTGAGACWEQSLLAACFWGGEPTVASHRAAAGLWDLAGIEPGALEIATIRHRSSFLVTVHRVRELPDTDVTVRRGIPATTVARTLFDLGSVCSAAEVEAAMDDALNRRLTTLAAVRARFRALGGRGRSGTSALRAALEARADGSAPPQSVLETRLCRLAREAGLPAPIPQFKVFDRGHFIGRVDFAYPAARLSIEVDGYRHHAGYAAWSHDRRRRNNLLAAGWQVFHVTWDDLVRNPHQVTSQMRRLLGRI